MLATPRSATCRIASGLRRICSESFTGSPLPDDARAAVAVVGAGVTGLSAALHLAEAGVQPLVLEARRVGHGATGRAFGHVVPQAKYDQSWIWSRFGQQAGERLIDFIAGGPDLLFSIIQRHHIQCDGRRVGSLVAAHHPRAEAALTAQAVYWQRRGVAVQLLHGSDLADAVGSDRYRLALLDPRSGSVNGLALARGMARAAAGCGARIVENCPIERIRPCADGWLLSSAAGEIRAGALVLATNAYGEGVWPGLGRCVIPMRAHALITRPLDAASAAAILPGGHALMDTRRMFSGIRKWPDLRLHVSCDGAPFRTEPANRRTARARLLSVYPQLEALDWEQEWAGWIAVSPSRFPSLHRLADKVWAALGYSGRGLALGTLLGREMALNILGNRNREPDFPVTALQPIASPLIARAWVRCVMGAYRAMDAWELRAAGPASS